MIEDSFLWKHKDDPQALFDEAVSKTYAQGRPALAGPRKCTYINRAGDRCAIGHLLDEATARDWAACNLAVLDVLKHREEAFSVPGLLAALQSAHDLASMGPTSNFRYDFLSRANSVARSYGLREWAP